MKLQHLRVAPTNPRRARRLIYILVAALLLTTTAVYAVYQVFPPPITDQGVEGIQEEGYTTPLNLVQRDGDVEVQLNWGYIDTSRAVLNYQIFAINPDGTRSDDHRYVLTKALLKNKDAVLEERTPSMDTAGTIPPVTPRIGTLTYTYPGRFDPSTMPNAMTLQLEVQVAEAKFSAIAGAEALLRSLIPIRVWRSTTPSDDNLYDWPSMIPRPESTAGGADAAPAVGGREWGGRHTKPDFGLAISDGSQSVLYRATDQIGLVSRNDHHTRWTADECFWRSQSTAR
jgi:hypothetical protein